MLRDVHGQRRLSHARPRRDDDHLGFVQSIRHPVELGKAGGNSGDAAAPLIELLDRLDRLHHLVLHRQDLAFEAIFADGENLLLHFIEEIVHFILFLEGTPDAFRAGRDDLAQNVFVPDDFEVVTDVGGRGHERVEIRYQRRAADRFKQISVAQNLGERDQVDGLACVPKIDKGIENCLVRGHVKIIGGDFLNDFRDRVARRDQHRAKHALLGFHAVRRGAVNILRRTCWRIGKNFSVASRRRTSASAISR